MARGYLSENESEEVSSGTKYNNTTQKEACIIQTV